MNKKHAPLIAAIALPIVFIIILALAIIIPSSRVNPEFDFVYIDTSEQYRTSPTGFQYKNSYDVKDGKIVKVPVQMYIDPTLKYPELIENKDAPTLYYYDVDENTVREISFAEAQNLTLDKGPSSPDGYNLKFEYNSDGIFELFGSDNNSGYFITKGAGKKQLSGIEGTDYYYSSEDIKLIGWIK